MSRGCSAYKGIDGEGKGEDGEMENVRCYAWLGLISGSSRRRGSERPGLFSGYLRCRCLGAPESWLAVDSVVRDSIRR